MPISDKKAETVAKALTTHLICTFGTPQEVFTDNGGEFSNELLDQVLAILEISHAKTPPYTPRQNPVERFHRTLKSMLRSSIQGNSRGWQEALPLVLFAYRTAVNSAHGLTPYFALFGREAHLPASFLVGFPPDKAPQLKVQEYAHWLRENFVMIYSSMRTELKCAFRRACRLYNDKVLQRLGIY